MLELRDIACRRGERTLFTALSIAIAAGRMLRVTGANGAGKTSLLRIVCGLLAPEQGAVLWRNQPVAVLREEFHRELIYLGHGAALKSDLTALENLRSACAIGGARPGMDEAVAALRDAGLAHYPDAPVRRLSQGQSRRVVLARLALGTGAPLWVLDEPFNALDSAATDWLATLVSTHLQQGGIVVLTSHQQVPALAGLPQQEIAL